MRGIYSRIANGYVGSCFIATSPKKGEESLDTRVKWVIWVKWVI